MTKVTVRDLKPGTVVTDHENLFTIENVDIKGMFSYVTMTRHTRTNVKRSLRMPFPTDKLFPFALVKA